MGVLDLSPGGASEEAQLFTTLVPLSLFLLPPAPPVPVPEDSPSLPGARISLGGTSVFPLVFMVSHASAW